MVQLVVEWWQSSHWWVVTKWLAGLPVTPSVPVWQVAHAPTTAEWSKWMVVQLAVMWQVSQAAVVEMWPTPWPSAVVPLWQVAHAPVTWVWSKLIVVQLAVM